MVKLPDSQWIVGEFVPDEVWKEIRRRGVAQGYHEATVITAELAERLFPKAEYLGQEMPPVHRADTGPW
jgi:hypothetical protein